MFQQSDVVRCGIPPRAELDAMLASPRSTDIPRNWISALMRAREQLDEADQLPDGSERVCALIDGAMDIEERAVATFNSVRLWSART